MVGRIGVEVGRGEGGIGDAEGISDGFIVGGRVGLGPSQAGMEHTH